MRWGIVVLALALAATPSPASAQSTGGAAAPTGDGGVQEGQPVAPKPATRVRPRSRRLTVGAFSIAPATVQPGGPPAQFSYRIDGPARSVRVRIDLVGADGTVRKRMHLGYKRTGTTHTRAWRPAGGELAAGAYTARLHATSPDGRRLTRTATASGRSTLEVRDTPVIVGSGVFPIQGPYSFGGEDARFGDDRGDHIHQGQDISAAEGLPVVTPRAGLVYWRAYQSGGAGHYVVIRGDDGRDFVFMHLQSGSIDVSKGDPVSAGQRIGNVGSTGRSQGPHLHFEIWPDGWYAEKSQPIDPLPDLQAWAAGAGSA